jgi:predicted aspartyl protease
MRLLPFFILTLLLAFPHSAAADEANEDGPWTLVLSMEGGFPVVSARTPGQEKPLRLIVDTAAGATVIDDSLAGRLGLTPDLSVEVRGAGGPSAARRATQSMRIMLADDLTETVQPVLIDMSRFAVDGIAYDGILGNDVLRKFDTRFDAPAGRLMLALPGSGPSPIADLQCIDNLRPREAGPSLAGFGMFDLRLGIAGPPAREATVRAVLDTGAAVTVLNRPAAEALGVAADDPRLRTHEAGTKGFGGDSIASDLVDLASAKVEEWRVGEATVRVSDLPVFKVLGLDEKPAAILGIDLLRHVPVGFKAGVTELCFGRSS